jgi:uncharacterized protein (TIGR00369 family)
MNNQSKSWSIERVRTHVAEHLPVVKLFGLEVRDLSATSCDVVINDHPDILRPGESVSGPVLFGAADVGGYGVILAVRGDPTAVTIDTVIHFLRPALNPPLLAHTTPTRMGRTLAILETVIFDEAEPERLLARATSTWAFP